MLKSLHRTTISSYHTAPDCPIMIYEREDKSSRASVTHYLTLAEAKTYRAQLDCVIEEAEAAAEVKAQAEREAAEFAAFKASRKLAADDGEVAKLVGFVERAA